MRWLLLTLLTFCSFVAQADKCNSVPSENIMGAYSFTPDAMSGTLTGGIFASGLDGDAVLKCSAQEQVWLKAAMAFLHSNKYAFKVGSKYYIVSFSVSYEEKGTIAKKEKYTLSDFFNMAGLALN
ncbi:hypothetical protein NNO02_22655, partial [Citrobacter sp. Awk 2]|uniref:hypothetical protein n=1 Tax=Citrobacter sp. Awk 2 TaxID=2963959 RepID=UPI002302B6EF